MTGSFLNMDDDETSPDIDNNIGSSLKAKRTVRARADVVAVAEAGAANGFSRTTGSAIEKAVVRQGRPPSKENMTYWRIYINENLRERLNKIRDDEVRRLNDVLEAMSSAYEEK